MRAGSTGARHLKKSHQHLLAQPAMKYQFMAEHCGDYPVTVMCHVRCRFRSAGTMPGTNVNRVSTAEKMLPLRRRSRRLLRPIDACTEAHGFRLELHAQGIACGQKRVARLMRELGICAQRPKHRTITTHSEKGVPVAANLQRARLSCGSSQSEVDDGYDLHLDPGGVALSRCCA